MDDMISEELLKAEQLAIKTDGKLYMDCMSNKLLKDRKTKQEIRDGLILYYRVYQFIKSRQ